VTAADIRRAAAKRGWACGFASVSRLAALRDALAALSPGVDPEVAAERLSFYEFRPPASLPAAASLIVVAVPLPGSRVWLTWKGARMTVMVPPAYLGFDEAGRHVRALLADLLSPLGRRVEPVLLPEKLLAASIGLAVYGRNNLAYVAGMGSFLRLTTFYTDLELEEDRWQLPGQLPRCAGCRACSRQCPTGAISADRFLLRAERCVVFHNERPSRVPFPDWMPASAHQCLVGCMDCQASCPENSVHGGWVEEAGELSAEETTRLLDGLPLEALEPDLKQKLDRLDLTPVYGMLARNLRAILAATSG